MLICLKNEHLCIPLFLHQKLLKLFCLPKHKKNNSIFITSRQYHNLNDDDKEEEKEDNIMVFLLHVFFKKPNHNDLSSYSTPFFKYFAAHCIRMRKNKMTGVWKRFISYFSSKKWIYTYVSKFILMHVCICIYHTSPTLPVAISLLYSLDSVWIYYVFFEKV